MIPGPIDRLVFTTFTGTLIDEKLDLDVGVSSPSLQVQTRDTYGHPANVEAVAGIMVNLSSSAGNAGAFSIDGFNWRPLDLNVTISNGTSSSLFYYKSSQEGQCTITAVEGPSQGWTDGSMDVLIGGPPVQAVLTGAPSGTVQTRDIDVTVGGTDVVSYKYKLVEQGDTAEEYGNETPVTVHIIRTGLENGDYTLYVLGKNSSGDWQADASPTTATWTVDIPVVIPPDPTGLQVEEVSDGKVVLTWDAITDPAGIAYRVFRSETESGMFYQVNTLDLDEKNVSFGRVYFTDRHLKNGTSYYYKVRSYLGQTGSEHFSNVVSATPDSIYTFQVNIIEPGQIKNIYGSAKYHIQIFPKENFEGSLLVNCVGLPIDLPHTFYLNGQEAGASLSNVNPPASIMLKITVTSTTPIEEHRFILRTTNTATGQVLDQDLTLTVVPNSGHGIHVEVEKRWITKGEPINLYGAIYPPIPGRQITITLGKEGDTSFPKTKNIQTDPYGKFIDDEWIATLGIGGYSVEASWVDDNTDIHNSAIRSFTVERGRSYVSCLRQSGVTPEVGLDFTISGSLAPAVTYPSVQLLVIDPDGNTTETPASQDSSGVYDTTQRFFNKEGIWKFKAYWLGDADYIGCESDYLAIPVGVDYGRVIILGGGEADETNTYWDVTKKLTVEVYRDFKAKGFANDMIYFMINSDLIDLDHDGSSDALEVVDDFIPASLDFTEVISSQFADDLNPNTPLFIYMQGHGTQDKRFKVLGSDQYVTAPEIEDALDKLQGLGDYQEQGGVDCNVILVLESCYSGNFISDLSGPNRVILTSAGDERYNTDASGRIAFSRYLFPKLREGDHLKKAFEYAKKSLVNMGYPSPRLDDNGDGVADSGDGLLASNLYLNGSLTWGLKPVIDEIDLAPVLEEGALAPIAVKVIQGDVAVEKVWVQVIAPDADITGGDTTINYPEAELIYNTGSETYEGTLTGLTKAGLYKIVVLAEDVDHEVSDPSAAYIS